jgi:diguanylate cyclase (GGDEF)-like protein/PAS domain S-box-containing protein
MKNAANSSPAVPWLSPRGNVRDTATGEALAGGVAAGAARRKLLFPALIVIIGAAISVGSFLISRDNVETEAELRFERQASDAQHVIAARIHSYAEVMYGLSALFSASSVSRAQFHRYVTGLDLAQRYPGFGALNYAEHVPQEAKARFEARVRTDTSLDPRGYPNFTVIPPGNRPEYYVLTYLEPMAGNERLLGLDISNNPSAANPRNIADALASARDSGKLTSSGELLRVKGPKGFTGLSMRLPVYRSGMPVETVEQRRTAFVGSIGAGFRVKGLMQGVLDEQALKFLRFRLYESGPAESYVANVAAKDVAGADRLLFDSKDLLKTADTVADPGGEDTAFKAILPIEVAGRVWEVHFSTPHKAVIGNVDAALPWLVLAGGLMTTVLLFGLFSSFANSRRRAEELAEAMTGDLRESKTSLAEAERMARLGNWSLDLRDGRMRWSDEAVRLLGLHAGDAPIDMQAFFDHVHPEDCEQVRQAIGDCRHHSKGFDIEHRIVVQGTERWVHGLGESRVAENGRVEFIRGTIMDISERKLGARRKELEATLARLFATARPTAETMTEVLNAICAACGFASGRYWEGEPDADAAGAIALPLVADQTHLGTIGLFGRDAGSLHPDLLKLLEGVVAQVAQYLMRRRAEDDFKHLATHDALTGLPNRLLFGEQVTTAIARSELSKRGLAVLLVDLDRFKNVNDTLGHGAGDEVLKACSERVARCLRDTDLIARISGDEFAILVEPCAQPAAAIAVARKVLGAIERPLMIQGHEIVLTGSVGISIYHEDGRDVETLLKHADIAMFRAKENGRNNSQFYSAQMNPHSLQRLALETALRRALERKEFSLHYQPKFDLKTGELTGVEALLRWRHAELGNVSPVQFIPIAEETGLIEPIGAWVLQEACAQAALWYEQGLRGVRIAVNLSARQFRNQKLGRDIRKCLVETGLDPRLLELELTESMVMQDPEQAATMLNELKSLGLTLSIDDFGTGYSSLAYLKRFPINSVKVDRSFVKDIPGDTEDLAIVEAVIALAHSLRLRVIAEGVETEEQYAHLQKLGCDEMQGYYKSKPLPVEDATRFLETTLRQEAQSRASRRPLTVVT